MVTTTTQAYQLQFTSTDGIAIECARWDSCGSVRGVVQIAHGLGEHIERYVGLIEHLVQAGLVVYGNDHRGHGRSALSRKSFRDVGPGGF
jgi:alpha-beta hydrolase superfamily lysophospholipase